MGHGRRVVRGFVSWLKGTGFESQSEHAAKSTCTHPLARCPEPLLTPLQPASEFNECRFDLKSLQNDLLVVVSGSYHTVHEQSYVCWMCFANSSLFICGS